MSQQLRRLLSNKNGLKSDAEVVNELQNRTYAKGELHARFPLQFNKHGEPYTDLKDKFQGLARKAGGTRSRALSEESEVEDSVSASEDRSRTTPNSIDGILSRESTPGNAAQTRTRGRPPIEAPTRESSRSEARDLLELFQGSRENAQRNAFGSGQHPPGNAPERSWKGYLEKRRPGIGRKNKKNRAVVTGTRATSLHTRGREDPSSPGPSSDVDAEDEKPSPPKRRRRQTVVNINLLGSVDRRLTVDLVKACQESG
ncbi:MAG: hypothetical protein M1831_007473 [Alyxoria varia]|nr:MAG: hypothetical protein M1831_007473 [Alyxoria varia]